MILTGCNLAYLGYGKNIIVGFSNSTMSELVTDPKYRNYFTIYVQVFLITTKNIY